MHTIRELKIFIPDDVHKDYRWAAKIAGHSVQQASFTAIEDYIAKVKEQIAREAAENEAR